MTETIFSVSPTNSWQVDGGERIYFPVEGLRESFRNRIIRHKRYKRDGARLEDTYSEAIVWTITLAAYNSTEFPEEINGEDFYPTELNKLLDSFLTHETGTLMTMTRGPRRCRAESYERDEKHEQKDTAAVVMTFVEDNEDDAEVSNWSAPTAASIIVKTADDAVRACEDEGVGSDAAASLNELAGAIESYASAPGDFVGDLEAKANLLSSTVDRIEQAHTSLTEDTSDELSTLLTDPSASRAGQLLRKLSDTAQRASPEKLGVPLIVPKTWPRDLSLYSIAPLVPMDVQALIDLNPGLNPFLVPAGTTIKVHG